MKKKKKFLLYLVMFTVSIQFFMPYKKIEAIEAIPLIAPKVITFIVVDNVAKYYQKVFRSKHGTRYEYRPKSGYGSGDRYWLKKDIKNHFVDHHDQYTFNSDNAPSEAIASIPKNPIHKLNEQSEISVASIMDWFHAFKFDWDSHSSKFKKGDIFFMRSATPFSEIAQYFTSWIHSGVVLDPNTGTTLESYSHKGGPGNDGGVGIFNAHSDWAKGISFSFKRLKTSSLSESRINTAVDRAKTNYAYKKPYFPKGISSHLLRQNFIKRWADKFDTSSYYCSKFVWKIFNDYGVDLDSNRTSTTISSNFNSGYTDKGDKNDYGWIGVSSDDIYYSKHLQKDIVLIGEKYLSKPIGAHM